MRVAQVIGKLADGGVEAVVNNYYRHTDASRFQFDYFIDDDSPRPPSPEMLRRGARYFRVPSSRRLLRRVLALKRLFEENGYAVVHAHMNTLNAPVLLAAKWAGVPVRISHNHSTADGREWKRTLAKRALRVTAGWFATDRMACGEAAGRWFFGRRRFDAGEVTVLPNAIELSAYSFDPAARKRLREQLGAGDALVIGHAGRFMPQKNHAFLLEAFRAVLARAPGAVLWLVGDGELRQAAQQRARALGISGSVRFLGPRRDLNKLYSAMDCFVLPSLYEGVPLVGVEAQAAGLPCLFSDHISGEVAATDRASFLSLDAPCDAWAEGIVAAALAGADGRARAAQALRGTLYDLDRSGGLLGEYYEARAGERARSDR